MNTTHLKYFLEVADAANITHAAEKLYISQQTLSNQIQKLEKSLGVMLFERKPALTLTYAGSRLYAYAKEMLEREAALQKELEEIGEGVRGSVTVGISYEIIKFAGRHDNVVTRIISAPGLWLQRLTTNEPDDSQIECAIAAMEPCIPENANDDLY